MNFKFVKNTENLIFFQFLKKINQVFQEIIGIKDVPQVAKDHNHARRGSSN
jgi:hypothetical protein